jgi:hypothetical protein
VTRLLPPSLLRNRKPADVSRSVIDVSFSGTVPRPASSRGAFEIRDLTDELLEMLNVKDVQIGAAAARWHDSRTLEYPLVMSGVYSRLSGAGGPESPQVDAGSLPSGAADRPAWRPTRRPTAAAPVTRL